MSDTAGPSGFQAGGAPKPGLAGLPPAPFWRDMGIVLAIGFLVRAVVLRMLPGNAVSYDLKAWSEVAAALSTGQNPYNLQPYLSWPPAWMQIVFFLDVLARHLALPLTLVLRAFLILADGLGILLAGRLIRRMAPVRVLWPLLLGWSLNPFAVLLVCQHGNFDGLVAICVLAALLCMIDSIERRDTVFWLWACAWLGAGVALKTIPLVLAPLSSAGRRSGRALVLGAVLLAGPALYGLSIIYALGPGPVRAHVLGYRSLPGWFGSSGLLKMAGKESWIPVYGLLFSFVLVSAMVWLAVRVRERVSPRALLFAAAGLLVAIPALGPGYGVQYVAWSWPLLLVLWAIGDRRTRGIVFAFGVIAVLTNVADYALMPSHGAFLLAATDAPSVLRLSDLVADRRGSTLERLPLFVAYLALLGHLIAATRRELASAPAWTTQ